MDKSIQNPTISTSTDKQTQDNGPLQTTKAVGAKTEAMQETKDSTKTEAETAPNKDEATKLRRTNSRKLATTKNVIRRKKVRLSNLKKKQDEYKKIIFRGYQIVKSENGNVKHIRLTAAEVEWYGIKIEDLKLEIAMLRDEISDLSNGLKMKAMTTKMAAREKFSQYVIDSRAKKQADKIITQFGESILADSKNGHATVFSQINEQVKNNETASAKESLKEYFSKLLIRDNKKLPKDERVVNKMLDHLIKAVPAVQFEGK